MQVSAILTNAIYDYNPAVSFDENSSFVRDPYYKAFTSYDKNEKSDINIFDLINEWKVFCHKQIEERNIDFLA